jgi:hypothetical protein
MAEVETLSPWWPRSAIVTIVVCFCVLGWLTKLTYLGAPPIPERVVGPDGVVLFTNADIAAGQQVFLRYGLMENGTIWDTARISAPISPLSICTRSRSTLKRPWPSATASKCRPRSCPAKD